MSSKTIDITELNAVGVSVTEYGAQGDGKVDDTGAIQKALESGAEKVVIPLGTYKITDTLRIHSSTRVVVHKAARIFLDDGAGTDQSVHLLSNADYEKGNADIVVEGGIWDGNNPNNPRGEDTPGAYTGVLISFSNVVGLRLNGLTVRNPESYFIRLAQYVRRFRVENIRFEALSLRPNQDGVHLGGYCEDGVIRNLQGTGMNTPNDDLVALNADDANERAQNLGKINGPVRRVSVTNIGASDCHTFVRCASVWNAVEDIEIDGVCGGCAMSMINLDAARYCRVPPFDTSDPAYAEGVGEIRNITVRNVYVYKTKQTPKPVIHLESRPYGLRFENFRRDETCDAAPETPTMKAQNLQPDVPLTLGGLSCEQAEGVVAQSELDTKELVREVRPDGAATVQFATTLSLSNSMILPRGGVEFAAFNGDGA